MTDEATLRNELVQLLRGQSGFRILDHVVADFPLQAMNQRPPNVPYTPWALLEHIRVGQNDILQYVRDPSYRSPHWPDEYWPAPDQKADQAAWDDTVAAIKSDRDALAEIIADLKVDLAAPLPHAPEHTILRELRLVSGHTSFHLGEFAVLRQVMGTWPADHKL
jgi:hypothetical protein